ncbi:MAG: hypothetical protein JWO38_3177 [Gemmataceae bacterium]|nr:hypothetical protein [Gemmataceae bacterium]
MKSVRLFGMCGLLSAAAAVSAAAPQDPKDPPGAKAPASTAQPGQVVPSTFRAFMVVDDRFPPKVSPPTSQDDRDPRDRTNKIHCLVCENGLSPVVAVFVGAKVDPKTLGADSGVGKLAAALNKIIPDYRAYKLGGFVTFLKIEGMPKVVTLTDTPQTTVELDAEYPDDEKRDAYATEVRDVANQAKAANVVFGLAPVKSKATDTWGIGPDDEVTVVIYNRLRVANRWTFKAADGPTDGQVKEIVAATEEMITGVKKSKD